MPPACFPTLIEVMTLSSSRLITSTLPGSPPIPSTEIKANLLSGDITTPCGIFVVVASFDNWVFSFNDQIDTAPSFLSVVASISPFGETAMLYGPSPASITSFIFQLSMSTINISLEPFPAIYSSFPSGLGTTHVGFIFEWCIAFLCSD